MVVIGWLFIDWRNNSHSWSMWWLDGLFTFLFCFFKTDREGPRWQDHRINQKKVTPFSYSDSKANFWNVYFLNVGNVGNVAQVVVVLVTGGCGYVGTHTVLQLLEQNVHVVVVDNLAGVTRGIYLKFNFNFAIKKGETIQLWRDSSFPSTCMNHPRRTHWISRRPGNVSTHVNVIGNLITHIWASVDDANVDDECLISYSHLCVVCEKQEAMRRNRRVWNEWKNCRARRSISTMSTLTTPNLLTRFSNWWLTFDLLFFPPLALKLIKIIVSFIFCPLVSIRLRHSFGRFEISRWFVQFATWLLPE